MVCKAQMASHSLERLVAVITKTATPKYVFYCVFFSLNFNAIHGIWLNSFQTDHPVDFHLANCLDYVRSGVEAIIEDEVTSRFEAEELKNWNLLTRTNRYHEFISWRLSTIWFIGFFIRYFILMPFRVIICFVGVSFQKKKKKKLWPILFLFLFCWTHKAKKSQHKIFHLEIE